MNQTLRESYEAYHEHSFHDLKPTSGQVWPLCRWGQSFSICRRGRWLVAAHVR